MTDHLVKAKDYIAIAESGDSKLAAYKKAADEIVAARKDDPQLSYAEIDRRIGRSGSYSKRLVHWRTNGSRTTHPFGGESENERKAESHTKAVLKDSERLERVISDLPTRALQELADRADQAVAGRREARREEHRPGVTGKDVGDFKPDEFWMDGIIIRLNRNAREAAHMFRQGGGLLGAMTTEKAFEYLQEAEQLLAEIRVAFQERVRDEVQV